jgi:hypothetical protein
MKRTRTALAALLFISSTPAMAAGRAPAAAAANQAQPAAPIKPAPPKGSATHVEVIVSPDGKNVTIKITGKDGGITLKAVRRENQRKDDVAAQAAGAPGLDAPVK